MAKINMKDVKKLREETGAGMLDCKKALEEAKNNYDDAVEIVREKGLAKAEKKQDRETKYGYIASYVHSNGEVASLVEMLCETDFVARNDEFRRMSKDIAMQVVAMVPEDKEDLMSQDFIKDPSKTVEDVIKEQSGRIGEKMEIGRFQRMEIGK